MHDSGRTASRSTKSYGAEGSIPAVFVSLAKFVDNTSGAVSICAHECLRTLAAAGFRLEIVRFDVDRRPLARLKRKFWPQPYLQQIPPFIAAEAAAVARKTEAKFVFLFDAAPLAAQLRQIRLDAQIVMLSVGLESVDYLHKMRAGPVVAWAHKGPRTRPATLARKLWAEHAQRRNLDHVFCLAPFEVEIERWLGAKAATWLPRTVPGAPIPWEPRAGRIGFVGSMFHAPNIEGLLQFTEALETLAPEGLRLRIVGAPETAGRALAQRFRFIDYLGPLSDDELEAEAGTWNCFVHPIFCYACGCSIKLAVGLGWRIPVVTTPPGRRGYTWTEGELPVADTPDGLARLAISMLDRDTAAAARREIQKIAESAPSVDDVAARIRSALTLDRAASDAQPYSGAAICDIEK